MPAILVHHILSLIEYTFREYRDFVFIIIVQFMMSANNQVRFGLHIVFVCLYITPSHVSKIKNIVSVIHYTLYGTVCFEFTNFPCDDWVNIYIYILCLIILIKLEVEVWTIIHCFWLGHETMVCVYVSLCSYSFEWGWNETSIGNAPINYTISAVRYPYSFYRKRTGLKHTLQLFTPKIV